jgi:hypothetical protein
VTTITVVNGGTPVTTVTTTIPNEGKKVAKYYQSTADNALKKVIKSDDLKFTVEHRKDSLFFEPLYIEIDYFSKDTTAVNSTHTGKYYWVIEKGKYISVAVRQTEVGLLTIPARAHMFRIGENPIRYSTDAGAGLYLGRQFGKTRFYQSGASENRFFLLAAYAGFSSIGLTTDNTTPAVSKDRTVAAFTGGLTLLSGSQDIQGGIAIGRDYPLTPTGRRWEYTGSYYLGLVLSLKVSPLK